MNGEHPSVILCIVKNENKLKKLTQRLILLKIKFCSFEEPDLEWSTTAIATQPLYGEQRQPFKRFQLLQ